MERQLTEAGESVLFIFQWNGHIKYSPVVPSANVEAVEEMAIFPTFSTANKRLCKAEQVILYVIPSIDGQLMHYEAMESERLVTKIVVQKISELKRKRFCSNRECCIIGKQRN